MPLPITPPQSVWLQSAPPRTVCVAECSLRPRALDKARRNTMGRLVPNALTKAVAIAALAWFVASGVGAVMALGVTKSGTSLAALRRSHRQGRSIAFSRGIKAPRRMPRRPSHRRAASPPFGCDSAFSRIAEPRQAPGIRTLRRLSGARGARNFMTQSCSGLRFGGPNFLRSRQCSVW